MEKSAIFIDGGYFNKILKNSFKESDIDYLKISELICKELSVNRLRTYYYHSLPIVRPNSKEDERRYSNMWKFISNLKRLSRFEVKLGRLQLIGGQFKQKMIDVLMSLDITSMCFDKQITQVILIAGDADFVPAIKKAKDYGAIVHLFYHSSSVHQKIFEFLFEIFGCSKCSSDTLRHNELLDEVDELHVISKELIESCKKLELK